MVHYFTTIALICMWWIKRCKNYFTMNANNNTSSASPAAHWAMRLSGRLQQMQLVCEYIQQRRRLSQCVQVQVRPWLSPPARPSLSQCMFTQLNLMTALLQHSALNSRALAASDKYSKSNRPVFALRLPDRPAARHRSTLTSLCHPKTLSNRHPRPPVYHCKSLENKSRREQIEVNEWYSGECNDGLIKGPGAAACPYGGLLVRWRSDSRMVLLANTPGVFRQACAFCES